MLDVQLAHAALEFLKRTELSGKEVDAYVKVQAWLQNMTRPASVGTSEDATDSTPTETHTGSSEKG